MKEELPPMSMPERSAVSGPVWLRLFKVAGFLAIGVGCLPLAMGLWNIVAIATFNATTAIAEAKVTSVPPGYGGLRLYYPCHYDQELGTVAIEHYAQQRGSYIRVGQEVRIRFQPGNPQRARLDTPRPYFWPGFFVVVGVFFMGFGLVFSRFPMLFKPPHT